MGNLGCARGGGIIRNANGEWVTRYARAIGTTTNVAAELWVLRDGINLCLSLNLAAIEIELDAKVVIDLLEKDGDYPNENDIIVADCREGLKKFSSVKIQHCFREANKWMHLLGGGSSLSRFYCFLSTPCGCCSVN